MHSIAVRAVALSLAIASMAFAQDTTNVPWKYEIVESVRLGSTRTVYVATPQGYERGSTKYPVLVLLDANDRPQFNLALANVAFLASRNAIPPLIVVGIPNGKDRTHDMTPEATGATTKMAPTAGGAGAFADFISDEVIPMVRSKYRALSTTVLAGHSYGGLFALNVAATKPSPYVGIVAMSPSLWWNDTLPAISYADVIAKSQKMPRLFATSGGLEGAIDRPTRRFVQHLDSIKSKNLAFGYRGYPNDTHGLTPAPSLVDGLRFVFDPVSVTSLPVTAIGPSTDEATIRKAVVESETKYAEGARSLGLPDKLPESSLYPLARAILQQKNTDLAFWIFQRNAALHPESMIAHDGLGDVYLAKGDTSAAQSQFRHVIDLATQADVPVPQSVRDKLAKLSKHE